MINIDDWAPSKFVFHRGHLRATRDTRELNVASRLIADLTARLYEEYIPACCRGKLIDLGCGKVPFFEAYRGYFDSVTCVDWPGSAHGSQFIDVAHDLTKPLPFPDQEFDTVLLSDVLEHIPEPQQLCNEMARILRPGGVCLMNTPFFYWLHEIPNDYYRFTEFAIRKLLENASFEIVVVKATGGTPEILTDILAKHISQIPVLGNPAAAALQWITGIFVRTLPGRKISMSTARSFPLSYFVVAKKK